MKPEIIAEIKNHAIAAGNREACGFIIATGKRRKIVMPAPNVATDPARNWRIDAREQLAAEKLGVITHVWHTHPFGRAIPTDADRAACNACKIPFLIFAWPADEHVVLKPDNYVPPLYGRDFVHGVIDCYTFIRDYYRLELKKKLPDFPREDEWWRKGQDLYATQFGKAGFVEVSRDWRSAQKHDVLLMRIMSPVENHGAVFLGQMAIGHHVMRRLSAREFYGQFYQDCTTRVLRHKSLVSA